MLSPTARIDLIQRSLRCYVFGWLSLIPLLGLGLAVHAINLYLRIRAEASQEWNPAQLYLRLGFGLSCLGLAISLAAFGLVIIVVYRNCVW